jgi:poly-gamma-glutamate synthesis protein (capsule biosynthesis protein)
MAAGDVMFAGGIARRLKRDPAAPFAGVAAIFGKADLALVNLECTISKRGTPQHKHYTFRAPPKSAAALAHAGIDIVSLANNHAMDYGVDALRDTFSLLDAAGVQRFGAGEDAAEAHAPRIVVRNGLRIAFLGYLGVFADTFGWDGHDWEAGPHSPGLALARKQQIRRDVAAARERADVVVVMYHAGIELRVAPSAFERAISRVALAAGAALVIGAHAHVLQGTARESETFVAYGLGNFIFDMPQPIANETAILDVTLTAQGVGSVRWVPIVIREGFPRRATGDVARRIRLRLGPV